MKTTITLEIKAKDFKPGGYFDYSTCPITKALKRAGFKEYEDSGIGIETKNGIFVTRSGDNDYDGLVAKVLGMFSFLENFPYSSSYGIATPIPVADFTHTLEIDIPS